MFFIVSNSKDPLKLDHHMNRLGYHFRHSVVEEARKVLKEQGHHEQAAYVHEPGKPEPIPNSQWEIDLEADAVLRDLFPRIPNTDRQEIINHAFKKDGKFNGEIKVGMAKDITLARRVQLAALAHIRHTHTRYDELLKESDWANARKAVEKPCLDIIVKWRGDEETGRDQLDEILREVIEISDTESESEDEGSSADNARIHVLPRTRPAAVPGSSRAVSRLSRPLNDRFGVDSQRSSPAVASPRTPSGVRKLAKADRRTARKTQQRFKRYAAAAEALANSSNQNGSPGSPSTPGFVATPVEVVRRQGSAHPVNTYRTAPRTVVHKTYIPRISQTLPEVQRTPIFHPNGENQARTIGMPRVSSDAHIHGGAEQFIRVPDAQRPKVGPYSANYNQPPAPPLSPVRLGLQDMLLPSIEPRSPDGARVSMGASQKVLREARQASEVPRVISRTIVEPSVPNPRPRSPGVVISDNETATKRRRVITYFPEDFQESPNTYVRVAPRTQDDAPRPQSEYLADGQPVGSRGPERVVYQDIPWTPPTQGVRVIRPEDGSHRSRDHLIPVTGDERTLMDSRAPDHTVYQSNMRAHTRQEYPVNRVAAPHRSRANPIVIDGDSRYEPRRIVEVRGSPAHDVYRTASPRGRGIHSPLVPDDSRIRGSPRVVYVDESTGRVTSEPGTRQHLAPQFQPGLPAYERPPQVLSPDVSLQPQHQIRTLEQPPRYAVSYDREIVQVNEADRNPLAWPKAISRGNQAALQEVPRLESIPLKNLANKNNRFVGSQHHPDISIPQQIGAQQSRDNVIYREVRPEATRPGALGYERASQPFPVHPAPSSYIEIRGPSPQRRIPDRRDMIYVE
ncbi:hypothetical protein F5Y09DRAFT_329363 [Xylaria sp. FL1042]|nr:hypothetical protein F5Y09DRAFT_329363 [Xylaria sp. FL1042]